MGMFMLITTCIGNFNSSLFFKFDLDLHDLTFNYFLRARSGPTVNSAHADSEKRQKLCYNIFAKQKYVKKTNFTLQN